MNTQSVPGTSTRPCFRFWRLAWAVGLALGALGPAMGAPLGTAFIYQGRLNDGAKPASGAFDFRFTLHDALSGGAQIGPAITNAVTVSDGVFSTTLDFGSGAFAGEGRWLEFGVRPNGSASEFTVLTPRQTLSPAPYALFALTPAGPQGPSGPTGPQGPSGPTGATGPQGAAGLPGPIGLTGPAGPAGSAGAAGAQGPQGLTGAQGPAGPAGATGPQGLRGLTWQGAWNALSNYVADDAVAHGGSTWLARRANQNVAPVESADWGLLAQKGDPGPTGPQGAAGLPGPIGLTGPAGPAGPAGAAGAQGPQGLTGAQGPAGPAGPQGPAGLSPFILVGTNAAYADGFVGVGTTNPATELDVQGTVTATSFAGDASGLTGLPASQLSGSLPAASLSGTYGSAVTLNNAANQFTGGFSGNGSGLTSLNASQVASGTVADARLAGNVARTNQVWLLDGNTGTAPGVQFLGTRDNRPLEFKVNGQRVLRLEINDSSLGAPNVIGGSPGNYVAPGVVGATIAGGGGTNYIGWTGTNSIRGDFALVGGGLYNSIGTRSSYSAILGGEYNTIFDNSTYSTIGGGSSHTMEAHRSFIGGGEANRIRQGSQWSTIGGGTANFVATNCSHATIAGGSNNQITDRAIASVIGGGGANVILADGVYGTIPGGVGNAATNNALAAGTRAKANHTGAFVWADSTAADFASTANNQFLIRASGGVGVNKSNPATALDVNGTVTATGFSGSGGGLTGIGASSLANDSVSAAKLASATASLSKVSGGTLSATGSSITFYANPYLDDRDLYLREDANHGLGWYGTGKTFAGQNVNGPALYGNGGGVLGSVAGVTNVALQWDASRNVTIAGTLNASGLVQFSTNAFFNDKDLLLRGDRNHGLGWYGSGKPFGSLSLDGPALYGYGGGALGTVNSGSTTNTALYWNSAGNVGIGSASPSTRLHVAGNIYATGTITPNSDRNLKTDFAPVDAAKVLARVATLPIQQWRFTAEAAEVKHIGPMAQDFQATFGLGAIPTAIATVDADGVALAAIQGLNRKVEVGIQDAEARIRALQAENAELQQRLERLERLVLAGSAGAGK